MKSFFLFIDVNECRSTNNCSKDAVCSNLPGSYSCSCKPGFTGDGLSCQGKSLTPYTGDVNIFVIVLLKNFMINCVNDYPNREINSRNAYLRILNNFDII